MTNYLKKHEIEQQGVTAFAYVLDKLYPNHDTMPIAGREDIYSDVEKYAGRMYLEIYQKIQDPSTRVKLQNAVLKCFAPMTPEEKRAQEEGCKESVAIGNRDLRRFNHLRNGKLIGTIVGGFQQKLLNEQGTCQIERDAPRFELKGENAELMASQIISTFQHEAVRSSREYLQSIREKHFAKGVKSNFNNGPGGGVIGF